MDMESKELRENPKATEMELLGDQFWWHFCVSSVASIDVIFFSESICSTHHSHQSSVKNQSINPYLRDQ